VKSTSKTFKGLLDSFKQLFISDSFVVGGHSWYYRFSEGEYDWVVALTAAPERGEPFHDPYNPFAIYAYKVRDPETGWEGYIFEVYPKGCGESACAIFLHTEATDEDLLDWMEEVAKVARLYYEDWDRFWHELEEGDISMLDPEELARYEFIAPSPDLAKKLADRLRTKRFVNIKHVPLKAPRAR